MNIIANQLIASYQTRTHFARSFRISCYLILIVEE